MTWALIVGAFFLGSIAWGIVEMERKLGRIIQLLERINENTYEEGKLVNRLGLDD